MTLRPEMKASAWNLAFPVKEASRALSFLHEMWKEISPAKSKVFSPSVREDRQTELFHDYLNKQSSSRGRLTGIWINENPTIFLDDPDLSNPKVVKRIRADITYFSNANKTPLHLIFEFKKIRFGSSSINNYIKDNGMGRFVDGYYAQEIPIAIMVGMVIDDYEKCIDKLKAELSKPNNIAYLKTNIQKNGTIFSAPSEIFPNDALFDTEHVRPAPNHEIRLSHLFLRMPST